MTDKKNITILGATGSIGLQTLDVISQHREEFGINFLTINSRIDLLEKVLSEHSPKGVVITDYNKYLEFKTTTNFKGQILFGEEGLLEAASDASNDLLISALVGFSGVKPTLMAVKSGIKVALANKESLVSAGSIITKTAIENNIEIIAIDSEHSAILQCLAGENKSDVEKLILTASGGPFLNTPLENFQNLTISQALAHPNWSMGSKITIDSATMMNKGFEVIEAHWLFGFDLDQIDVLIHPQSIIHSMVLFHDGSIKAQLGLPDMRMPISYALGYPDRKKMNIPRLDFMSLKSLTFDSPDLNRFPALGLAYQSMKTGGTSSTIMNAANEIAVSNFLNGKIKFPDIVNVIEKSMSQIEVINNPTIDNIIESDTYTREYSQNLINKFFIK